MDEQTPLRRIASDFAANPGHFGAPSGNHGVSFTQGGGRSP